MAAEDRVGRVGQVCLGVIRCLGNDPLRIMARLVAHQLALQAPLAARIRGDVKRVRTNLRDRGCPLNNRLLPPDSRRLE